MDTLIEIKIKDFCESYDNFKKVIGIELNNNIEIKSVKNIVESIQEIDSYRKKIDSSFNVREIIQILNIIYDKILNLEKTRIELYLLSNFYKLTQLKIKLEELLLFIKTINQN